MTPRLQILGSSRMLMAVKEEEYSTRRTLLRCGLLTLCVSHTWQMNSPSQATRPSDIIKKRLWQNVAKHSAVKVEMRLNTALIRPAAEVLKGPLAGDTCVQWCAPYSPVGASSLCSMEG